MSNYFANSIRMLSEKAKLREKLRAIHEQEEAARREYLTSVSNIIKLNPGRTASQYAAMLSNDADERNSIATSIGMMGYMASNFRRYRNNTNHPECVCTNPSLLHLYRETKTIKRRFIEVDESNNPIGTFEINDHKTVYSMDS